jgi:hypothetical protein
LLPGWRSIRYRHLQDLSILRPKYLVSMVFHLEVRKGYQPWLCILQDQQGLALLVDLLYLARKPKPTRATFPISHYIILSEIFDPHHKQRRHNPINHHTKQNLFPDPPLPHNMMQTLISYLTQDRIHHNQQPHRYTLLISILNFPYFYPYLQEGRKKKTYQSAPTPLQTAPFVR